MRNEELRMKSGVSNHHVKVSAPGPEPGHSALTDRRRHLRDIALF
jgi:hypothetical protein